MDNTNHIISTALGVLIGCLIFGPIFVGMGSDCGSGGATTAIQSEIAACNKQKMSWNRLEIREGQRGFVRCIDHRTNQTKLVPVTY